MLKPLHLVVEDWLNYVPGQLLQVERMFIILQSAVSFMIPAFKVHFSSKFPSEFCKPGDSGGCSYLSPKGVITIVLVNRPEVDVSLELNGGLSTNFVLCRKLLIV